MADRPDVEIQIPPSPEYVGVARHVIAALVRMSDLDSEIGDDVKLAVSEATTNAVTVTGRAGSAEPVLVRGEARDGRILLTVTDRGARQAAADTGEGKETDSLDFTFEGGLSMPLLEGLVDELEITPREGGGSIVRMVLSASAEAPPTD
jgi:serine/threonine-protein kinase RsbW